MNRRSILGALAALSLAPTLRARGSLAAQWPSPVMAVLDDIDLGEATPAAEAAVNVFMAHRIPLTVAISSRSLIDVSQSGAALIGYFTTSEPHLLEMGLKIDALKDASHYHALRAASDAQTEFRRMIRRHAPACWQACSLAETIITDNHPLPDMASRLRAAGIRTVIGFEEGKLNPSSYALTSNGVAFVKSWSDPSNTPLKEKLGALAASREPVVLRLSAASLAKMNLKQARDLCETTAAAIDAEILKGTIRYLTPRTLHRQTYAGEHALRLLRLVDVDRDNWARAVEFFKSTGVGLDSLALLECGASSNGEKSLDSLAENVAAEIDSDTYNKIAQALQTQSVNPGFSAEEGSLKIALSKGDCDRVGLDKFGCLHIPNTTSFHLGMMGWNDESQNATDSLVRISAKGLSETLITQFSPEALAAVETSSKERFVTAEQYYRATLGSVPVIDYIQHARVAAALDRRGDRPSAGLSIEDAQIAWRYFQRFAKRYGNLAPATAWTGNQGADHYPIITMWDLGSLLLAALSARRLSLIDDTRLAKVVKAAQAFLAKAVFVARKSRLPAINWSIAGEPGDLRGFDAADAGRLLIALKAIDAHTSGDFKLSKLVASWDLAAALADGKLHDHTGKRWKNTHRQLYSLYAARGFELWGFETAVLFSDPAPDQDMDRAVKFITEAAERGPFATEPFVTDEIELGATHHSRLIADVVFAAQMARYRSTGTLTAMSEGPIDVKPWFTYQGLSLTETGATWRVDVPPGHQNVQTQAFERDNRLINSKAAYLWGSTRPHEYTKALVEKIRSSATTQIGFASGVREKTDEPTKAADINTNALILESVAYALTGRTPLLGPAK
jgi:hypothetical protein